MPSSTVPLDDPTAGGVQILQHTPIALRRDPIQAVRSVAWFFPSSQLFLDVLPLFVVELIDGLHRFAGHQARNEASFI